MCFLSIFQTFHDVDLILENDNSLYRCDHRDRPRHLSAGVNTLNYRLPYSRIFGGVTQLTAQKFEHVNGYSNIFWGWGGEDDDLYTRLFLYAKYEMIRANLTVGRYKMIKHKHEFLNKPNKDRHKLLLTSITRMFQDGIEQLDYEIVRRDQNKVFEKVIVDIGKQKKSKNDLDLVWWNKGVFENWKKKELESGDFKEIDFYS